MTKTVVVLVALVFGFICLIASCSQSNKGLSPEAKAAADKALVALRKMDGAIELGNIDSAIEMARNYPTYRTRLVETKAEVESATAKLPEGELKKEINLALEPYIDVLPVLDYKSTDTILVGWERFSDDLMLTNPYQNHAALMELLTQKYPVSTKYKPPDPKFASFSIRQILMTFRQSSRKHTDRASTLLE